MAAVLILQLQPDTWPISHFWLAAGTFTLRFRYPDGHGILRRVLNEATQRGFVIDDLAADRLGGPAAQGKTIGRRWSR